jgi:hypothetical protein
VAETGVGYTPGSGTNVDAYSLTDGKVQEAVVLGDGTNNGVKATVFPGGFLRVSDEPVQLFYDPFDTALDTTNMWTSSSSGGASAPLVTVGTMSVGTGTTASGTASLVSIPTFKPTVPSWLGVSFAITLSDAAAPIANSYRFWGMGSAAGTTIAGPFDGVGFEITTAGHMCAVVYSAGTRVQIADLTSLGIAPTNASPHRYGVYVRTDRAYWFIDTLDNIVASSSFQSPSVQTLPVKILAAAGTTPASSATINCTGLAVWDTGKNSNQVSDGTYPWRKAHVGSGGELYAALTSPNAAALGMVANINPYGTQRVTVEPTPVFMDAFDGTVIDTNKWTVTGTQPPTQGSGAFIFAPTVGANVANNSLAVSQPTFVSPGVGFLTFSNVVTLEAAQTASVNVHRFWGKGQVTSFAYATPLTDAVGFEVDGSTGALQCVVYINGTKYVINSTTIANITSSLLGAVAGGTPAGTALPTGAAASAYGKALTWQGGMHRYAIMVRSDAIYWFVEGTEIPVAVLAYASPSVQQLPLRVHSITNSAATSLANTFSVGAMAVNDNTAQNNTISDPVYQFRRAWVTAGNGLQVAPVDGGKTTYSAIVAAFAAPAGIFFNMVGSATKTVRITRISLAAIGTTAATIEVVLLKTSTAASGGTVATTLTAVPVDSADAAATAVAKTYSAVPTTGNAVGPVRASKLVAPLTGAALTPVEWLFGNRPGERALVLRGVAQTIQISGSAAITGASFVIEVEWTEE